MSKAEFVGSFMCLQFYDGHHWQMSDEMLERYASLAGPGFHDLMRFWTLMYLAFVFRKCVTGLEGEEFEREMMTSLYSRLKQLPIKAGEVNIGTTINCWMLCLDVATKPTGTYDVGEHKDVEMPACLFAALAFIKYDPGSPYYMRENPLMAIIDNPTHPIAQVIKGLAKVHDEMLPRIQSLARRIEVP